MNKIMDVLKSQSKNTFVVVVVLVLVILALGSMAGSAPITESIEVGVATLSPAGESGGYAIPASCGSGLCISLSQDKNTTFPGETFIITWTSSGANSCTIRWTKPDGTRINPWISMSRFGSYPLSGSTTTAPTEIGEHRYRLRCISSDDTHSSSIEHIVEALPQCSDGIDNDGDLTIDYPADSGCYGPSDNTESTTQCSDFIDNDNDGTIDYPNDVSCSGANDDDEANPPQCNDGIDNDGDGLTDYGSLWNPGDPDCDSDADNSEAPPPPSLSIEASPTLIRSGSSSIITWSTTNVNSCVITGSNGFYYTTTSGSVSTGVLTEQSTYTLSCESDAGPATVSIIINVLPVFEEI